MPVVPLTSNGNDFLEANKDKFVILFFDAEFSGQQDLVKDSANAVSNAPNLLDKVVVGTVDVEANDELAKKFQVLSVPMVVCLAKGKSHIKIDTLETSKLIKTIEEELKRYDILSGDVASSEEGKSVDPKERFNEYLKKLTSRSPVMIFMKGQPEQPRCGFSKQLVALLAKHDIQYDSFDILQDEDVRQGLKEFSDWPTYPQVYAKGEFIGGLDILKQLDDQGELVKTLKGE